MYKRKYNFQSTIVITQDTTFYKDFPRFVNDLYAEMMAKIFPKGYNSGSDEYNKRRILDGDEKGVFLHDINVACLTSHYSIFDYLPRTERTIETDSCYSTLLSVGIYPYREWKLELKFRSKDYTVIQMMPPIHGWVHFTAHKGDTLTKEYVKPTEGEKVLRLKFNTKYVEEFTP